MSPGLARALWAYSLGLSCLVLSANYERLSPGWRMVAHCLHGGFVAVLTLMARGRPESPDR